MLFSTLSARARRGAGLAEDVMSMLLQIFTSGWRRGLPESVKMFRPMFSEGSAGSALFLAVGLR